MAHWQVRFHPRAEAEIEALPADLRARFLRIADLLIERGPQLVGMPHVRPLEGGLWEMRMQGRDGIGRAVYVICTGRTLYVLHAFVKKTQRTPRAALATAHARRQEIDP